MHLRSCVIEGRYAEEDILMGLGMVLLLYDTGGHQRAMGMEDGFWKSGSAGGEIDGCIILILQFHSRCCGGAIGNQFIIAVGKGGFVFADIEIGFDPVEMIKNLFHPPDEFRTEDQSTGFG